MGRVSGKTAIVTGCASSRSLGFAIARALLKEGAHVTLTDISDEVYGRAAELDPDGRTTLALQHDVTREADWEKAVGSTVAKFGGLDILVNNAGIIIPGPVTDMDLAAFNQQMNVNVSGVFLGCKAALPAMLAGGRPGSIINISSTGGMVGSAGVSGYCATKGAVRLLTKSIALEYGTQQIRCNSIHPGLIETAIHDETRRMVPAIYNQMLNAIPMQRAGSPDDIAYCALYLASDEANYVTGAEFLVDGGITAG